MAVNVERKRQNRAESRRVHLSKSSDPWNVSTVSLNIWQTSLNDITPRIELSDC